MSTGKKELKIHVPGLKWILPENGNISYYPQDGLTIVIYGAPGSGKTQLALQMALSAAMLNKKNAVYLTKEAQPESLIQRVVKEFKMFGLSTKYETLNKVTDPDTQKDTDKWSELNELEEQKLSIDDILNKQTLLRFGRTIDKIDKFIDDRQPEHYIRFMNLDVINKTIINNPLKDKTVHENVMYYMDPKPGNNIFAFGNLQTPGFTGGLLDRYSNTNVSSLIALSRFCPDLAMLFHSIAKENLKPNDNCELDIYKKFVYKILKKTDIDDVYINKINTVLMEKGLTWGINKEDDEILTKILNSNSTENEKQCKELNKILFKTIESEQLDQADFDEIKKIYEQLIANNVNEDEKKKICTKLHSQYSQWHNKLSNDEFNNLNEFNRSLGIQRVWTNELIAVCDSVSPEVLEECVRNKRLTTQDIEELPYNPDKLSYVLPKMEPVWIYILDTPKLPENMIAAYPPDIQIELGRESRGENIYVRNIQIHKARHQKVNTEKFTFTINSGKTNVCTSDNKNNEVKCNFVDIDYYRPGINIFPSFLQNPIPYSHVEIDRFKSQITKIDNNIDKYLTESGYINGGCTLLLTENRCHAMNFGLHYLLNQFSNGSSLGYSDDKFAGDVLYICMDGGISGALRDIAESNKLMKVLPINEYFQIVINKILMHDNLDIDSLSKKNDEYIDAKEKLNNNNGLYEKRYKAKFENILKEFKKKVDNLTKKYIKNLIFLKEITSLQIQNIIFIDTKNKENKYLVEISNNLNKILSTIIEELKNDINDILDNASKEDKELKTIPEILNAKINIFSNALLTIIKELKNSLNDKKDDNFNENINSLNTIINNFEKINTENGNNRNNEFKEIRRLNETFSKDKYLFDKIRDSTLQQKNIDLFLELIEAEEKLLSNTSTYFFKIKNNNTECSIYILAPQIDWKSPEEILHNIRRLIDGQTTLKENKICRVLFNRVGHIQNRWPLVTEGETKTFISNLITICWNRSIDIMIIDDTAEQTGATGQVSSRWLNIADNIVRLKRSAIHGANTVALEVLRTRGQSKMYNRPMELCWEFDTSKNDTNNKSILKIRDTFRGYSGVFTDKPKHCKIKLTLPYDREDSLLQAEVLHIKSTLEMLFDEEDVEVNTLGPDQRTGMNSALAHLANLTHETCHVTAVDEIWLLQLLDVSNEFNEFREPALSSFTKHDLQRALPDHIIKKIGEVINFEKIEKEYVSDALALAHRQTGDNNLRYAIPYYNNWGVFVVNKPFLNVIYNNNSATNPIWEKINNLFIDEDKDDILQKSSSRIVSWQDLRDAKKEWDKEVKSFIKEDGIWHIDKQAFYLDFFGFEYDMQEAVVCFFFELLLSKVTKEEIFKNVVENKLTDLKFKDYNESDKLITSFTDVLKLMYDLLSPRQRKKVGWGLNSLINNKRDNKSKESDNKNSYQEYCLFSREWITGITPVELDSKIWERNILRHLPVWDKNSYSQLYDNFIDAKVINEGINAIKNDKCLKDQDRKEKLDKLEKLEKMLRNSCYGRGPTVSGTWYLGALRGGNIDLAADVIHELVSEERELERIHTGKGAPVSKKFYTELEDLKKDTKNDDTSSISKEFCDFPYTKIIRLNYELNEKLGNITASGNNGNIFPFCRLQIKDYPLISSEIYDLVRHVMRLPQESVDKNNDLIKENVIRSLIRINKITKDDNRGKKGEING
jgi:hypothetical protein